MAVDQELQRLTSEAISGLGLELWDMEQAGATLRVSVEKDGGIDLDSLSEAARQISGLLDSHEELTPGGQFELEVSSPGLERRLRTAEHFRRYLGRTVTVKTAKPVEGTRRFKGSITRVGDADFSIQPDDGADEVLIPLSGVEKANLVLEWGAAPKGSPKPGAKKQGGTKQSSSSGEQHSNKEKM